MLRLVVRTNDATHAVHAGGPVETFFKTFDIEASDLEAYLRKTLGAHVHSEVIGVEVLP